MLTCKCLREDLSRLCFHFRGSKCLLDLGRLQYCFDNTSVGNSLDCSIPCLIRCLGPSHPACTAVMLLSADPHQAAAGHCSSHAHGSTGVGALPAVRHHSSTSAAGRDEGPAVQAGSHCSRDRRLWRAGGRVRAMCGPAVKNSSQQLDWQKGLLGPAAQHASTARLAKGADHQLLASTTHPLRSPARSERQQARQICAGGRHWTARPAFRSKELTHRSACRVAGPPWLQLQLLLAPAQQPLPLPAASEPPGLLLLLLQTAALMGVTGSRMRHLPGTWGRQWWTGFWRGCLTTTAGQAGWPVLCV